MSSNLQLYETLKQSEYGQELESRIRFNDFKPEWTENEQWCDLLGDDVNNLRHMRHTYNISQRFINEGNIDFRTAHILGKTAITHDIGEAIIGDIPLPAKTHEDERKEEIAYRAITQELYGTQDIADTVWSVLNHTDEARGDMFRAIEYVGYCTTAMRAGTTAMRLTHSFSSIGLPRNKREQLTGALLGLENAVRTSNYPVLSNYVKKYPFLERVI